MGSASEVKRSRGRPRSSNHKDGPNRVKAVDRAIHLLKTLAQMDQALLTELSLKSGVAPSSAYRLLTTMRHHEFVSFDDATQNWNIGVEAFRVGRSFGRNTSVIQAGREHLRGLMEITGETANLGIADDGDVVFVSQVETHSAIRAFFRPGTRAPMHASGVGKVLLAGMSEVDVQKILYKKGLQTFTPHTLSVLPDLMRDLVLSRIRGWALDDQESNLGMRCMAAPVFNEFGETIAGLSISGPILRISDERLGEFGPLVKRKADELTKAIGGILPTDA